MSIETRVPHYGVLFGGWLAGEKLEDGVFRLESCEGGEDCALEARCLLAVPGSLAELSGEDREAYIQERRRLRKEEEQKLLSLEGTPACLEYTFLDWEDGENFGRDLLIRKALVREAAEKAPEKALPEAPAEEEAEETSGGTGLVLKVLIAALAVAIVVVAIIFGKIILELKNMAELTNVQPTLPVATMAEEPAEAPVTEMPTEAPTEAPVILDPTKMVDLSIGKCHTAAVYEDGSVDVVYLSEAMRRKYPAWDVWDAAEAEGWTDIVQVSVGRYHMAGLKKDGTVVAIGDKAHGECDTESWTDIIAIATLDHTTLGLKADGTMVSAGSTLKVSNVAYIEDVVAMDVGSGCLEYFQKDGSWKRRLSDGSEQNLGVYPDLVKIYSNENDSIGILSDGTVVVGRTTRLNKTKLAEWTDIVDIYGDASCLVGVKKDGSVCVMGTDNQYNQQNVVHWAGVEKMVGPSLGLKKDGTLVMAGTSLLQSFDFGPLNKAPSVTEGKAGKIANSSSGVNARAYPGINCDVVTRLPMGTGVTVLEEKTTYDGMVWGRTWYGWISMDFIALDEA